MKQYILLLFIMIPLLSYSKTDMEKLLERVDHAIEMDGYYQQQKEKKLKRLRREAGDAITAEEKLCYLDSLYRAYSTYRQGRRIKLRCPPKVLTGTLHPSLPSIFSG